MYTVISVEYKKWNDICMQIRWVRLASPRTRLLRLLRYALLIYYYVLRTEYIEEQEVYHYFLLVFFTTYLDFPFNTATMVLEMCDNDATIFANLGSNELAITALFGIFMMKSNLTANKKWLTLYDICFKIYMIITKIYINIYL